MLVDLSFDLPLDSALFRAVGEVAAAFYEQRFTLTCWAGTKFCYGCATSPAKRPMGECGGEIVVKKTYNHGRCENMFEGGERVNMHGINAFVL